MAIRRGFTLFEIIIYLCVFAITGLLIASIFQITRRTQQSSTAAHAVSGETDTAIRWLRQDLQDTALGSIRTFPGPVASMSSGRTVDAATRGKMLISEYGVIRWRKHVVYSFQRRGQVGNLVRWEVPFTDAEVEQRLPRFLPSLPPTPTQTRVILHNVLAPGASVSGLGGIGTLTADPDYGGFKVQFFRRNTGTAELDPSDVNPALNLDTPEFNSRLVNVELAIAETALARPNVYRIRFRVCPRY